MKNTFFVPAILSALCVFALPQTASAEIDHFYDYRFGVGYSDAPAGAGRGQTQTLYEGRYTTRFSHQTDSGVRFRFDLTVAVGNIIDRRPPETMPGTNVGIEITQ